jgi:hypothetical protein
MRPRRSFTVVAPYAPAEGIEEKSLSRIEVNRVRGTIDLKPIH